MSEVPPHVPDIAVAGEQFPQHGLSLAAVGAFEVPVLHYGDRTSEVITDLGAPVDPGRDHIRGPARALQRRGGTRRPSWTVPAVVSWAGTRGVVPLAAALSIPLTSASGAPLAQRDLILVLATAVIVVSLIVQGLTLEPLARFTGIARPADARQEETVARLRLAEAALARLDELAGEDAAPDATIGRVRASLQAASAAPAPGSTAATDQNPTA